MDRSRVSRPRTTTCSMSNSSAPESSSTASSPAVIPGRSRPVHRTRIVRVCSSMPASVAAGSVRPSGLRSPVMVTSNPALDELGGYPLARLQDLANQLRADGVPLHDLSIGDPDEPTPQLIRDALIDALGPVSRYPTAAGRPALRRAIAGWVGRRHGVVVDPDRNVLPTAGSKEAIFHLP